MRRFLKSKAPLCRNTGAARNAGAVQSPLLPASSGTLFDAGGANDSCIIISSDLTTLCFLLAWQQQCPRLEQELPHPLRKQESLFGAAKSSLLISLKESLNDEVARLWDEIQILEARMYLANDGLGPSKPLQESQCRFGHLFSSSLERKMT